MPSAFKWRLLWTGTDDREVAEAAFKNGSNFYITSAIQQATRAECNELIAKGEMAPWQSYWQIDEGEVGLITSLDMPSQHEFGGLTPLGHYLAVHEAFRAGWYAALASRK